MILAQAGNTTIIAKQSWRLRMKALGFILKYAPTTLPLVLGYSMKNRANPGDIAILAITEAILPELQKELKERDAEHKVD